MLLNLLGIYNSGVAARFTMLFIGWLIWPGLMFLVGFIGESRLVPIVKHQSRAFLPGDLAFVPMLMALLGLQNRTIDLGSFWGYNPVFIIAVYAIMIPVALWMRHNDVKNYPKRSGLSPTKITHDFCGYYLIFATLIVMGIPQLIDCIITKDTAHFAEWATFGLGLAYYIVCVIVDAKNGWTIDDVKARHPEDWAPIWARKK